MLEPLRIACLLALIACVGSFIWAMSGQYFRRVDRAGWGFRAIQLGGALAFTWNVAVLLRGDRMEFGSGLAGLALYGTSLAGFWWAISAHAKHPPSHAFSGDVPVTLVQRGPYRLIRHPFYSSYLCAWAAGAVATHEWLLTLPLGLMAAVYFVAARLEERKFERSGLAGSYQAYRVRTGMFLPWL